MIRAMRRIALGVLAAAAACHRPVPTAREHLLSRLPGDAILVVVGDGRAIAHPRVRAVLDAAAGRWPAGMACVLAAAYASEQVALTFDRADNAAVTIAIASPPSCPALSQREPGLWIATIGAGPAVQAHSVLDDARFARARPYLTSAPIAAAMLGDLHAIATAQPEPLEAWLAVDVPPARAAGSAAPGAAGVGVAAGPGTAGLGTAGSGTAGSGAAGSGAAGAGAAALEQALARRIATLASDPATRALAAWLQLSRIGDAQVVVRLGAPGSAAATGSPDGATRGPAAIATQDLAAAARAILASFDDRASPEPARFTCPPPGGDVVCSRGTSYRVRSLRAELETVIERGNAEPVVDNESVIGLRLGAAVAPLGLAAGDVVLAIDGRRVVSRAMFLHLVAQARGEARVTVRRGTREAVLELAEH